MEGRYLHVEEARNGKVDGKYVGKTLGGGGTEVSRNTSYKRKWRHEKVDLICGDEETSRSKQRSREVNTTEVDS